VLEAQLEGSAGELSLDVRLAVGRESVLIAGPNGAGKSTLLRLLLGLETPSAGRVVLDGRVLFDSAAGIELPPEDRLLGYVPQDYALFPHLDVRDNVAFGLARLGRDERRARTQAVLESMELAPLARRRVQTLSGGERQRVALARALAPQPRALLLDEPFAALDAQARQKLRRSLAQQLAEWGLPALIVSHDPADAPIGQRLVVLEQGRVVQQGTIAELRAQPATGFVAELCAQPSPA
jgi:molybdate transport system ATP-binding protein